jgi:hypothetical protein
MGKTEQIKLIVPSKKVVPTLEMPTFHSDETKQTNPFIGEIERTAIVIPIP